MSITGAPDEDGGEPTKVGVAISDVVTGMLGAVAVLAALVGRERDRVRDRRRGPADRRLAARIDPRQPRQPGPERVRQRRRARAGSATPTPTSSRTRRSRPPTARSRVAVGSERQWPRLCAALGLPALAADPRFATNGDRVGAAGDAPPAARRALSARSTADWLAALDAADIPCGPINDILAAFASPEAAALGMTVEQEHPAWGVIRQVGVPFELSAHAGVDPDARRRLLGEHTDEILAELGYDAGRDRAAPSGGVV